jgi:hypothetical protein
LGRRVLRKRREGWKKEEEDGRVRGGRMEERRTEEKSIV